jgi:hypothetical protein
MLTHLAAPRRTAQLSSTTTTTAANSSHDEVSRASLANKQAAQEEDCTSFSLSVSLVVANLASRSFSIFPPYSVKTPSFEIIRIGPPWFLRPSPGVRSIFSRCGGSFMCAIAQATMSSLGLLCEFEVDELSCGEDDELLLGTGEAINNDLMRVAVICR